MFDNNIPNGFIYKTPKNEYVKTSSGWVNGKTLVVVESHKVAKLENSARKQIAEMDMRSKMKVGKTYILKNNEYTYLGESRFSLGGIVLSEDSSKLLEDEINTKDLPPDAFDEPTPNGFSFKALDGNMYVKTDNGWYNQTTNHRPDYITNNDIDLQAIKYIWKYNQENTVHIGDKFKSSKGQYVYLGDEKFANTETGTLLNPNTSTDLLQKAASGQIQPVNRKIETQQEQSTDDSNTSEPEQNGKDEQPEQSNQEVDNSVKIPIGFKAKSSSGNIFIKTSDGWKNASNGKILNKSASSSLEKKASEYIEQHNASSNLKIGSEFNSKSGKTYVYTGNDSFSEKQSGKPLNASAAKELMKKINSKKEEPQEQPQEPAATEPQTGTSSEPEKQTPTPEVSTDDDSKSEPEVKPNNPVQNYKYAEYGKDYTLDELADIIKNNPNRRKIYNLLQRDDPQSILACDILLSGLNKEAIEIIKNQD